MQQEGLGAGRVPPRHGRALPRRRGRSVILQRALRCLALSGGDYAGSGCKRAELDPLPFELFTTQTQSRKLLRRCLSYLALAWCMNTSAFGFWVRHQGQSF